MKTFKGYEDSDNFRQKMEEKINYKYPDLAQKVETGFMPLTACIEMLYTRAVYAFGFTGEEAGLTSEVSTRLLEIYLFFKDISKSNIIWILIHMIGLKREFMMSMTEDQLFTYLSNAEFITDIFNDEESFNRLFKDLMLSDLNQEIAMHTQERESIF